MDHVTTFPRIVQPAAPDAAQPRIEVAADTTPKAAWLDSDGDTLPAAERLLVLVPFPLGDEPGLAQRIWGLASPRRLKVLYLGLCANPETEPRARRQLASLAAMTRDDWSRVDTRLEVGSDWIKTTRAVFQTGDLIVCHAEQQLASRARRQSLGNALAAALEAPVCLLSGFCSELPEKEPGGAGRVFSWAIPIAIILAFFVLQMRIEMLTKDWAHAVLLVISVAAEYALVALWSHFTI